jgi:hypothetical protein
MGYPISITSDTRRRLPAGAFALGQLGRFELRASLFHLGMTHQHLLHGALDGELLDRLDGHAFGTASDKRPSATP